MPKVDYYELKRQDKLVLRDSNNQEVQTVIFPNGIQVGIGDSELFSDATLILPTIPTPSVTANRLYNEEGTLKFNGAAIGSGGGSGTPGGSDTQVQFNDGGSFGGSSAFTYAKTTEKVSVTSGSFSFLGVNNASPKTRFSVTHDYNSPTFENQLAAAEGGGDTILYGAGSLAAGKLYWLSGSSATWTLTDSDSPVSGSSQLLGIALGSSPTTDGVLLKGFIRIASGFINGTAAIGDPVYVDNGTSGEYNFTAPSGAGDYVRVVGYCIDTHSSDILLYFNPDPTWVEIS